MGLRAGHVLHLGQSLLRPEALALQVGDALHHVRLLLGLLHDLLLVAGLGVVQGLLVLCRGGGGGGDGFGLVMRTGGGRVGGVRAG